MQKLFFSLILFSLAPAAMADLYLGGNGGVVDYGSDITNRYKVSSSGTTYGVIVGMKLQFIGGELFYQKLSSEGKIKHSGVDYKLQSNTAALGAALRLNFGYAFIRIGYSLYRRDQGIFYEGNVQNNPAMNNIYGVQTSMEKSQGFAGGGGLQMKLGKTFKVFGEYTRYNLSSLNAHYNAITAGIIINIPNSWKGLTPKE